MTTDVIKLREALEELRNVITARNRDGMDWGDHFGPLMTALGNVADVLDATASVTVEREPVVQGVEAMPWRCFHCDEVFTDSEPATLHFGTRLMHDPACQIDVAEYRAMEKRMEDYNEEDAEIHREMAALRTKHRQELIREEEKGYARGLDDGMKLSASPSPALPVDKQAASAENAHTEFDSNMQNVHIPPAPPSGSELPPLPEGMPKTEGMMWNQMQFASDMVTKYGKASEEKVMLKKEWERECADGDKIIEALGMTIEEGRTEGGSLHIARIKNRIKELAARSMPAKSVSDEVIAIADAERLRLSKLYQERVDTNTSDMGQLNGGNMDWARLEGAVAVVQALRRALLAESSHAPEEVDYELRQDGMTVAATSGSGALKEIQHYAAQYQQDGPIEIYEVTRRKIAASPDLAQKGTSDGN